MTRRQTVLVYLVATALGLGALLVLLGPNHLITQASVSEQVQPPFTDPRFPGKTIVDPVKGPLQDELEKTAPSLQARRKAEIIQSAVPSAFGFTRSTPVDGCCLFRVSELKLENSGALHMLIEASLRGEVIYYDYLRIVNPPIMVPTDPPQYRVGTQKSLDITQPDEAVALLNFREDPYLALRDIIAESVITSTKAGPHLPAHRGTTTTVYANTTDGYIFSESTNSWASAQSGGDGTFSASTGDSSYAFLGSAHYDASHRAIIMAAYAFDTSAVGSDTVDDVTFSLVSTNADYGNDTGDLEARVSTWGTLTTADWVDFTTASNWTGLPDFASIAVSSWVRSDGTRNDFTEGTDATANINGSGTTEIKVVNSLAYGSEPGVFNNSVGVYFADNTGTTNDPRLVVNHTAGGGPEPRRRIIITLN